MPCGHDWDDSEYNLPKAYGECTCICHMKGSIFTKHIIPCCNPEDDKMPDPSPATNYT